MQIRGSRILLTGASGGLGEAIALELARRRADLVLTARRAELLEDLARRTGGEVVVADLSVAADVDRVTEDALGCDVIVLNAGIGGDGIVDEATPEGIDQVLDVNLRAPIQTAVAFAQHKLAERNPGHIVLVGSLSGVAPTPNTFMYNATKFGLRGFAHSLGQDLDGTPVGLTLVAPGFIRDAGMFHDNDMDLPPGVRTKSPQDVADAVVRGIEHGDREVYVAPPELRAMASFAGLAPGLAARVQKLAGVSERTARR
ncbi:MAG: SDR family NAD(P)-dependent oxidoreductase [Acidobacteria bacterium]|nr:SDR family NAD(P)-dependent oxidoreductase [Acidobacteriota bacterium]